MLYHTVLKELFLVNVAGFWCFLKFYFKFQSMPQSRAAYLLFSSGGLHFCSILFCSNSFNTSPCISLIIFSPFPFCSSTVNDSRQVLQEPDFAQALLRDPNTPIIRKSRGTSTQGTSTHASSTHLAMLDDVRSKASSVHSKMSSYHGSLHRSRDGR